MSRPSRQALRNAKPLERALLVLAGEAQSISTRAANLAAKVRDAEVDAEVHNNTCLVQAAVGTVAEELNSQAPEVPPPLSMDGALMTIADGHGLVTIEHAREVCQVFSQPFDANLVMSWTGQADANPSGDYKGLQLAKDEPGQGVPTLQLSNYIVRKMELDVVEKLGRGSQAQANAFAVREHFADVKAAAEA